MALGAILMQARERKGLTPQQVAETTRMLVQIVEDLEREDFRRIAAPLYGRGFIKLYAECVGLDPEPLVAEFIEIFTGTRPPQIARRTVTRAAAVPEPLSPPARESPAAPAEVLPDPPLDRPEKKPAADAVPAEPSADAGTRRAAEPVEPAVMPLDESDEPSAPDLFTRAEQKKPFVARTRVARPPAAQASPPPRVRPFSGRGEETESAARPPPDEPPAPAALKPRTAPVWSKSRVAVREVAKIWTGVSRLPSEWLTPRRAAFGAGALAGVLLVVFGIRFLMGMAERSASGAAPVVSQRVHPPPPPYYE